MVRSATLDGEQANRRHLVLPNGAGYWRSDLILSAENDSPAPQAFLIQQDSNTLIRSHFHTQDQFQVVIEGGGTLGRHALNPVSVHYASRHTGYGPIQSGDQGLSYFTLRAVTTPHAHFLPESRELMANPPRRNLLGPQVPLSDPATRHARIQSAVETLLEPRPDCGAAWLLRVPPKAGVAPPSRSNARGDRFYLVAAGGLNALGEHLPRFAAAFVSTDEADPDWVAGEDRLEVLVLEFPTGAGTVGAHAPR